MGPGAILGSLLVIAVAAGILALKIFGWKLMFEGGSATVGGQALEDAFNRRRERPAGIPQVAGEECSICERTIISEKDAVQCLTCSAVVHRACTEAHACPAARAADQAAQPYRQ